MMKSRCFFSLCLSLAFLGCTSGSIKDAACAQRETASVTPFIPVEVTLNQEAKFGLFAADLVLNEQTFDLQPDPQGKMSAEISFQGGKVVERPWWGKPSCSFHVSSNVTFWNQHKMSLGSRWILSEKTFTGYNVANVEVIPEPTTKYSDGSVSVQDEGRRSHPIFFSCFDGNGKFISYDSMGAKKAFGKLLTFRNLNSPSDIQ
jgi:hypothetical protein